MLLLAAVMTGSVAVGADDDQHEAPRGTASDGQHPRESSRFEGGPAGAPTDDADDVNAVRDANEDDTPEAAPAPGLLELEADRLALLDLHVARIESVSLQQMVPVRAEVLDPSPLLDLAAGHAEARADITLAEGELAVAQATVERLRRLRVQGENATLRELEAAELRAAAGRAARARAEARRRLAEAQAQLDWGEAGRAWVAGEADAVLEDVMNGKARLLRVEAPADAPPPAQLELDGAGLAPGMPSARLMRAAPRLTSARPLEGWWYRLDDGSLPLGRRIAGIPWPRGPAQTSLRLPAAAILWYGGQAWVWRQESAHTFRRLPVRTTAGPDSESVLVVDGPLSAGEQVVVRGAGQLLGEEFAGVIPSEDDD